MPIFRRFSISKAKSELSRNQRQALEFFLGSKFLWGRFLFSSSQMLFFWTMQDSNPKSWVMSLPTAPLVVFWILSTFCAMHFPGHFPLFCTTAILQVKKIRKFACHEHLSAIFSWNKCIFDFSMAITIFHHWAIAHYIALAVTLKILPISYQV